MALSDVRDLLDRRLTGTFVHLSRLQEEDIPQLWTNLQMPQNTAIWQYLLASMPTSYLEMWQVLSSKTNSITFAVRADPDRLDFNGGSASRKVDRATDGRSNHEEVLGVVAYYGINPEHRALDIGTVILSPQLQRTTAATEVIYLLLKHVFDDIGHETESLFRRIVWRCNSTNDKSRKAAQRFGFTYEGTLRRNRFVRGVWINSDWFSIIEDEWTPIKKAFQRWLDESNFDAQGRQKLTLEQCR